MNNSIRTLKEMKWESPSSFDAGIKQVILEDTLDEVKKRGVRTRFVQFSAGAKTEVKFIHDYHEEVYLVKGDQLLLCENSLEPIKKYNEGEYFTRKAGTYHGPFSSESGCLLLEIHYY